MTKTIEFYPFFPISLKTKKGDLQPLPTNKFDQIFNILKPNPKPLLFYLYLNYPEDKVGEN